MFFYPLYGRALTAKTVLVALTVAAALFTSVFINKVSAQPGSPAYHFLKGVNDSCINPATIIDPLFIPKYGYKEPVPVIKIRTGSPFLPPSSDTYFYILCGLFLFVGISVRAFPKYFADLYRVFMRSGFRQKSIRDQLVQNKIASLGLNTIFFITGGLFIYLISRYEMVMPSGNWYSQALICIGFLVSVYLVKYFSLMAGGWVFSSRELVENYAFLVFFVNKIAGLFLLPVVLILWLGSKSFHPVVVVASFIVISFLYMYRYFLILPMVRNKSGVSSFHFFLYLCTFEILPVLLLVKFLVNFLNSSN
jgi:Domain of unknown function (DUF4271)